MKKLLKTAVTALLLFSTSYSQSQVTKPKTQDEDATVVKISTELIQLDVSVTDKDGKTVPGLTVDDFEVFENGEKQTLSGTNFVYRAVGSGVAGESKTDTSTAASVPGFSKAPKPSSVRRTIAIVVDDL